MHQVSWPTLAAVTLVLQEIFGDGTLSDLSMGSCLFENKWSYESCMIILEISNMVPRKHGLERSFL